VLGHRFAADVGDPLSQSQAVGEELEGGVGELPALVD